MCHRLSACVAVTPQDYQPPGFKDTDSDSLEFQKEPVKLTMGEVVTPFHTLKLDMGTERHRLEQVKERRRTIEPDLGLVLFSDRSVSAGGRERPSDGEVGSENKGEGHSIAGQHTK